jgi:TRAP-type mannitol/chloroaromatic compound transport system permease small subunit
MSAMAAPGTLASIRRVLDRLIGTATAALSVLVLPVSLLLFLQWPLRDLVHAYAREANDLAQWLFALYMGAAVTYATRRDTHLAAHAIAHRYAEATRAWLRRAASLLVLVPWSLFVLVVAWQPLLQSVGQLEAFPDTFNPGYFLIKIAAWLMALLVLLQAVVELLPRETGQGR